MLLPITIRNTRDATMMMIISVEFKPPLMSGTLEFSIVEASENPYYKNHVAPTFTDSLTFVFKPWLT